MVVLVIYMIVGLILFAIAEIATILGNMFNDTNFNINALLIHIVIFGLVWPLGLYLLIRTFRTKRV